MEAHQQKQLRTFLLEKLAISPRSLDMAVRLCEASVGSFYLILYPLIVILLVITVR